MSALGLLRKNESSGQTTNSQQNDRLIQWKEITEKTSESPNMESNIQQDGMYGIYDDFQVINKEYIME